MGALIGILLLVILVASLIKAWEAPYKPTVWDRAGFTKQTYQAKVKPTQSSDARIVPLD